jgi:CHAT domain-containing protein
MTRALLRAVAVSVLVLSFSGCPASKAPTSAPEPNHAEAICAIAPAATARAHLDAADTALDRGCPRRALELLSAIPSPASPEEQARGRFIAYVARADSVAAGHDRRARTNFIGYERLPWLYPDGSVNTDLVFDVGGMIEAFRAAGPEALPYMERSDHATLFVRWMLGRKCMSGVSWSMLDGAAERQAGMFEFFERDVGLGGTRGNQGAREELLGVVSLHRCQYGEAAKHYQLASSRYDGAGMKSDSLRARLYAIEATAFDEGGAAEVGYRLVLPQHLPAMVAAQVAAANGGGELFDRGRRCARDLDELEQQPLPNDLKARAQALRASCAFALRGQPEEALTIGEQAVATARLANRADLVDRAQLVRLISLLELGRQDEATRVADALQKSLVLRGAMGALDESAMVLSLAAQRFGLLERSEDAIPIGSIVQSWRANLGAMRFVQATGAIIGVLIQGGLFEDARPIIKRALAAIDDAIVASRAPDASEQEAMLQPVLEGAKEMLLRHQDTVQTMLGLVPSKSEIEQVMEGLPFELRPLFTALEHGDLDEVRRLAREPVLDEVAMARNFALASIGHCRIVGAPGLDASADVVMDLIAQIAEAGQLAGQAPSPELMGETISGGMQLIALGSTFAFALAQCGAALGDYHLAQRGAEIQRAVGTAMVSVEDPIVLEVLLAYQAAAAGRNAEASRRFEAVAERSLVRAGLNAASGVGASQTAASWYEEAIVNAIVAKDTNRAVRLLETSRSRDLRALRALSKQGNVFSGAKRIEEALTKKRGQMRSLVTMSAGQEGSGRDAMTRAIERLAREIETLEGKREQEARRLAQANPAAYRAAAFAPPPSLAAIQAALGDDEIAVYYVESGDRGWAIVIGSDKAETIALPLSDPDGVPVAALHAARFTKQLEQRIRTGRGLTLKENARPAASLDDSAAALYAIYGRPLEGLIPPRKRIIFIAGPTTLSLPLAMLGGARSPWIQRNPMRIAPTASFLLDKQPRRSSSSILVVGDPAFEGGGAAQHRGLAEQGLWKRLPGTAREARAIAEMYGAEALTEAGATETAIVEAATNATVLHFATHGYGDPNRPANSALVLAKPASGEKSDGILYAYEVERLALDADLVVLSACETGKGQQRGSEGVLALDRAFLVAGARTVVSSLWVVDDDATAALMQAFHRNVRGGKAADVALAEAVRETRKQWPDPYFWSAFRVIGTGLR